MGRADSSESAISPYATLLRQARDENTGRICQNKRGMSIKGAICRPWNLCLLSRLLSLCYIVVLTVNADQLPGNYTHTSRGG